MNEILKSADNLFKESKYNISLLANASAFLKEVIKEINWVGFYLFKDNKLILGPFQGKVACEEINIGEGVCGYSFKSKTITNVENVHNFQGHIACDLATNSELVIPLFKGLHPIGVLDIDSELFNRFDENTIELIKRIADLIVKYYLI